MPIYEFECSECLRTIEELVRSSDTSNWVCDICGGVMVRKISVSTPRFKGAGFYETDYKKGGDDGSGEAGGAFGSGGSGE